MASNPRHFWWRSLVLLFLRFLNKQLQHHHFGTHEAGVNNACVQNIEHLDNAIDLARLESLECLKIDNIKPQEFFLFPVGHGVLALQKTCGGGVTESRGRPAAPAHGQDRRCHGRVATPSTDQPDSTEDGGGVHTPS